MSRFPVHGTTRLQDGLPSLRRKGAYRVLRRAFGAGTDRFGFRLAQWSVQTDHLHLIVEATHRCALSRGMQGLLVRIARSLNRLWRRRGSVLADRYHARVLRTPREVRNALHYVLQNARQHGIRLAGLDPFSSADTFDGWRGGRASRTPARARTWLLRIGWRRHGLLDPSATPGGRSRRARASPG